MLSLNTRGASWNGPVLQRGKTEVREQKSYQSVTLPNGIDKEKIEAKQIAVKNARYFKLLLISLRDKLHRLTDVFQSCAP